MANEPNDFEAAGARGRGSAAGDFVDMLKRNKKWWLLPIVIAVVLVGVLVILSSTAAAPFIYTLF